MFPVPAPTSSTRSPTYGSDHVRHPARESRRPSQPVEDFAAVFVRRVDSPRHRVAEDGPYGAHAILPANFLALTVRPSGVADGHFENPAAALRELDGQLRLDVERRALERDALQQIGPHHLVARLHVGQIQVAHEIAQKRQELVTQRVPEEKRALVAARHESRSKNGVRFLDEKHFHHFRQVLRVIFEVRVVDHHKICVDVGQSGPNRRALAAVLLVAHPNPRNLRIRLLRFKRSAKSIESLRRPVRRSVVDHDNLDEFQQRRIAEHPEPRQTRFHQKLLVVNRNDNGKSSGRPPPRRAPLRKAHTRIRMRCAAFLHVLCCGNCARPRPRRQQIAYA